MLFSSENYFSATTVYESDGLNIHHEYPHDGYCIDFQF